MSPTLTRSPSSPTSRPCTMPCLGLTRTTAWGLAWVERSFRFMTHNWRGLLKHFNALNTCACGPAQTFTVIGPVLLAQIRLNTKGASLWLSLVMNVVRECFHCSHVLNEKPHHKIGIRIVVFTLQTHNLITNCMIVYRNTVCLVLILNFRDMITNTPPSNHYVVWGTWRNMLQIFLPHCLHRYCPLGQHPLSLSPSCTNPGLLVPNWV